MQTAKPLKKGEFKGSVGLSAFANTESILGNLDANIRYGIDGKSDIGLGLGFPGIGHYTLEYKRQLFLSQSKGFYLSSGLAVEGLLPSESSDFIPALSIPLYLSFNHNGRFQPYLMQRYTISFTGLNHFKYDDSKLPIEEEAKYRNTMLYSGGIGLQFGSKQQMFFEITYFTQYEFFTNNYYSSTNEEWNYKRLQTLENVGVQVSFGFVF